MSEQGKEDEQLLQDASTLLMFANVAAKQSHGHGAPTQQPPQFHQKPNLPHIKDLMNPTGPQHPPYQQNGAIYGSGPLRSPPLVGSMPPRSSATSQIPQLGTQYNGPQAAPLNRMAAPSIMGQPPAHQIHSHHQPHSHAQPSSGPTQHPEKERPTRSPYANIEPKPPLSPSVQFQRYSESQSIPSVPRKSPSPLASVGPIKSPGAVKSPGVAKSPGKSPGPASVALARGINLASGERNNDNAHLAAAALAAAADMPLPLRRDSLKKENSEESPTQTHLKPALETEEDSEKTEDESSRASIPPKDPTESKKSNEAPGKASFSFTVPPLDQYRVDPDAGVIGCICGIEDDDGFTVQCDICFRWQHCICMGFYSSDEIPEDEYKCYFCDTSKWGKMDPATCREETIRRLEAEQDDENVKDGEKPKRKQSSDSADTSKRRKTEKGKVDGLKSADRRKQSRENSSSSLYVVKPEPKPVFVSEDNDQVSEGNHAEPYQSVYYKLKANDFKTPHIKELLSSFGTGLSEKSQTDSPRIVSLQEFKNLKLARILGTKNNREPVIGNPEYVVQVKCYSENAKQKFNGITRMGLYISHSDFMSHDEDSVSTDATESKDVMSIEIPEGTPVIEYLGEIDKFDNYKKDSVNQYALWGSPKPNVIRVKIQNDNESPLDLVLDARFVGNEARFIRKSCPTTSNCKVVPMYVKDSNTFRFIVVTTKPIQLNSESPDEELRLDWEWDETHPIRKMYGDALHSNTGVKFDQFSDVEKSVLISGVDNILNFVECGCSSSLVNEHHNANNDCAIFKVKKATSYLLRSTRKASGISNVNITKSKDELIPRQPREFVSWEQKLIEREKGIRMELRITTKDGSLTAEDTSDPKDYDDSITSQSNDDNVSELSYKQQLMKKARTAPKSAEVKQSKTDVEKVDISQLPIPVSQNLKAKVAETITKKTEGAEISSARPQPAAKQEIIAEVPLATKAEEPVIPLAEEAPKAIQEERPAPKVKKLSFADYKKKMK